MLLLQLFDISKSAPAPNIGPELNQTRLKEFKIKFILTLGGSKWQMVSLRYEIAWVVNPGDYTE